LQLSLEIRIAWIEQHRDQYAGGNQFAHEPQAFALHLLEQDVQAGRIAAGPIEAGDQTQPDRIIASNKDDRNGRRGRLGGESRRGTAGRDDQRDLAANQIGCQCRQAVGLTFRRAVFNLDVLTLGITGLFEPLAERGHEVRKPVR
jgi:hypothetical protein